jgi:hypothetical protein
VKDDRLCGTGCAGADRKRESRVESLALQLEAVEDLRFVADVF